MKVGATDLGWISCCPKAYLARPAKIWRTLNYRTGVGINEKFCSDHPWEMIDKSKLPLHLPWAMNAPEGPLIYLEFTIAALTNCARIPLLKTDYWEMNPLGLGPTVSVSGDRCDSANYSRFGWTGSVSTVSLRKERCGPILANLALNLFHLQNKNIFSSPVPSLCLKRQRALGWRSRCLHQWFGIFVHQGSFPIVPGHRINRLW
jgi:hypothetical protein